ncbi:MAG: Flp pilus assembly complex ATPase component TadA [Desulfobacterales bacterium]|nr:Flp pilus assembly complex ATPase component TadA [Desulfobacterales bacterium]
MKGSAIPVNLDGQLKHAERYISQGLYEPAFEIYKKLLSDTTLKLSSDNHKKIIEKIEWLKNQIDDDSIQSLSPEELSLIKDVKVEESIPEILESANSFKELGLFQDAIVQYDKLLEKKYPLSKIIANLLPCLFEVHDPYRLVSNVEELIKKANLKNKEASEIKILLGQELEKRKYFDIALEVYEAVKSLDPDNKKIDFDIDSIRSRQSYKSRYDYLIQSQKINALQLQGALAEAKKSNKSVEYVLMEHFKVPKEEMGRSLTFFYKHPFQAYDAQFTVPFEMINKCKKAFLIQDIWVPLSWSVDGIEVLVDNPSDIKKIDNIKNIFKAKKLNLCVGIKEDIEAFIKDFYEKGKSLGQQDEGTEVQSNESFELLKEIEFEEIEEKEAQIDEMAETSNEVVKLVDQILVSAYRQKVSDIHIEPSPITNKTTIRFRVDGVCHEALKVPNSMVRGLLSRLKIMSGLNIAEKRLPQDGKIKFKRKGIPPFELRLATVPTSGGFEDAVLRILAQAGAMKLDDMGLSVRNLSVLKQIISQPYGLILVVGPTGSGKTTTLHSALGYINKPGVKIWTAEDPVEITQQGLRQVQANPQIGLDFARIMRAFLRADPDVIMIGEMRDKETASIGVEASLTGHLVFSTLHTNSAPETVTRLLDMGLNPLNFSDAFLGVLAQRLARRLCKKCSQKYNPQEEEFDDIVREFGKKYFGSTSINYSEELFLHRPQGCPECSNKGYKGRLGIHELMEGTKEIKKLIKIAAPTEELIEQAIKQGMNTLKQDGILKMFQGITDLNEIKRVCI